MCLVFMIVTTASVCSLDAVFLKFKVLWGNRYGGSAYITDYLRPMVTRHTFSWTLFHGNNLYCLDLGSNTETDPKRLYGSPSTGVMTHTSISWLLLMQ